MSVNRAYKYYLKTTEFQDQKLNQFLKICCWFHNYLLKQFRIRDKNNQPQFTERELQDLLPKLKKEYSFLKQAQSTNLFNITKQVFKIWQKYKELKALDSKKKYPNFKPTHRYNSLVYLQSVNKKSCGYKIDNSPLSKKKEVRKLRLSLGRQNNHNIQLTTKIVMSRNFEGDCKTLTIKRKNGRFYACFSCENVPLKPLQITNKKVGIDMNLEEKSYLTLSNGTKYKHPKCYKKSEKELIGANRNLSSKAEGSQNWKDAKLQLAKKWEKVVNQSKYYSYQIANKIVKEFDVIKLENLKIMNMVRNRCLSKSIQQTRWGIQRKTIAEEAEIATRQLFFVPPHNTSQRCSNCGELNKEKLTLKDRIFKCWNCDLVLDRDINSAINILNSNGSTRSRPRKRRQENSCLPLERGQDIIVS
ncbi:MAG: transposase [Candidatus Moeniiplasma glomeromycotorum]|nr:transposase [Candidatus Moeniiplasma glomeromycotorum]MCE8168021.1 transposase [Candidatus Moeniiplasma glomeromycotorum]MCE8169689.1 transposase [Candidatus Moeniiplasma glomeromycotorum]